MVRDLERESERERARESARDSAREFERDPVRSELESSLETLLLRDRFSSSSSDAESSDSPSRWFFSDDRFGERELGSSALMEPFGAKDVRQAGEFSDPLE